MTENLKIVFAGKNSEDLKCSQIILKILTGALRIAIIVSLVPSFSHLTSFHTLTSYVQHGIFLYIHSLLVSLNYLLNLTCKCSQLSLSIWFWNHLFWHSSYKSTEFYDLYVYINIYNPSSLLPGANFANNDFFVIKIHNVFRLRKDDFYIWLKNFWCAEVLQ